MNLHGKHLSRDTGQILFVDDDNIKSCCRTRFFPEDKTRYDYLLGSESSVGKTVYTDRFERLVAFCHVKVVVFSMLSFKFNPLFTNLSFHGTYETFVHLLLS